MDVLNTSPSSGAARGCPRCYRAEELDVTSQSFQWIATLFKKNCINHEVCNLGITVMKLYCYFLSGQIILSTLCAFLMKTRKVWLFSAHLLPLLARLCAMPHATLLTVNTFSMGLTGVGIFTFLLSNIFVPYRLARAAYSELLHLEVLLFWNPFL